MRRKVGKKKEKLWIIIIQFLQFEYYIHDNWILQLILLNQNNTINLSPKLWPNNVKLANQELPARAYLHYCIYIMVIFIILPNFISIKFFVSYFYLWKKLIVQRFGNEYYFILQQFIYFLKNLSYYIDQTRNIFTLPQIKVEFIFTATSM